MSPMKHRSASAVHEHYPFPTTFSSSFSCFSTPFFLELLPLPQTLKGTRIGADPLSRFLRRAVQSCLQSTSLCGRAVLVSSEPASFISPAQGHDLADFSPFPSSPCCPRCLSPELPVQDRFWCAPS